eukprot:GHVU01098656.1.p1 GENE.GHVU01098656.1~~GHVU01098656.1.p1  ORF type:complete len:171 (-),score=2.30 GHVU01098656.1:654-1166(-)
MSRASAKCIVNPRAPSDHSRFYGDPRCSNCEFPDNPLFRTGLRTYGSDRPFSSTSSSMSSRSFPPGIRRSGDQRTAKGPAVPPGLLETNYEKHERRVTRDSRDGREVVELTKPKETTPSPFGHRPPPTLAGYAPQDSTRRPGDTPRRPAGKRVVHAKYTTHYTRPERMIV